MRDITLEDTFTGVFTTRAFATGIPTTLAGTPVLSVKESGNDTPITAGVSVDIDTTTGGVTGMHEYTVVATAANGYAAGSYAIYISTGTVGGVSVVGEVLENFTIASSAAAVDLANGTDGLGAIKADTAAVLVDTADMQPKLGTPAADISADIAAVKVDTAATLVDTADMQPKLGTPAADVSADIAAVKVDTAAILLDTAEIGAAGAGLTAINLPNQTMDITGDITGNLSGSVGSVTGAVGSVAGNVDGNVSGTVASVVGAVGSIAAAGITSASFGAGAIDAAAINSDAKTIERNTAFSDLEFLMVLTSDHVTPATGLTVTGQRSIDGAAFGAVSGAIAEVGNGIYQFDALAADTNGGVITYRFSSATADDTFITITTEA